jgi:hypothetical protein
MSYRFMSNYPEQIRRYYQYFEPENILILLQEDMHSDTAGIYKKVLAFIKVDSTFCANFPIVNANKKVRSKSLRSFLTTPPKWLRAAGRAIFRNEKIQHALRHKMRMLNKKMNAKTVQRTKMPTSLYNSLLSEKAAEIIELGELIDRDISHWLTPK